MVYLNYMYFVKSNSKHHELPLSNGQVKLGAVNEDGNP